MISALGNVEAALFGCGLDLVDIADEDDVHQIVLDEAVSRFENTASGPSVKTMVRRVAFSASISFVNMVSYLHYAVFPLLF